MGSMLPYIPAPWILWVRSWNGMGNFPVQKSAKFSPRAHPKSWFWIMDSQTKEKTWILACWYSLGVVFQSILRYCTHIYIYTVLLCFFAQVFFESFQKGAGNDILGTLLQNMYVHYQHSKTIFDKINMETIYDHMLSCLIDIRVHNDHLIVDVN
jgi:hypothetical protein